MQRLAMHRDRNFRTDHLEHADQLVAGGMAGNVNEMIAILVTTSTP